MVSAPAQRSQEVGQTGAADALRPLSESGGRTGALKTGATSTDCRHEAHDHDDDDCVDLRRASTHTAATPLHTARTARMTSGPPTSPRRKEPILNVVLAMFRTSPFSSDKFSSCI